MEEFKGFTKRKPDYTIYGSPDGHTAEVYDDRRIFIIPPTLSVRIPLEDLADFRRKEIQPLIDFIEKDLGHNFTIAENEIED